MKASECSGLGKTGEKAHAAVIRWNIATQQTESPTGSFQGETCVPFTDNLRSSKGGRHGCFVKPTAAWLGLHVMDLSLHFREHLRRLWSLHQRSRKRALNGCSFWGSACESVFTVGFLAFLGGGGRSDGILSNCYKPAYVAWLGL